MKCSNCIGEREGDYVCVCVCWRWWWCGAVCVCVCVHLFEKVQSGCSVSGGEQFHDTRHDPSLILCLLQQSTQSEEGGQHGRPRPSKLKGVDELREDLGAGEGLGE